MRTGPHNLHIGFRGNNHTCTYQIFHISLCMQNRMLVCGNNAKNELLVSN